MTTTYTTQQLADAQQQERRARVRKTLGIIITYGLMTLLAFSFLFPIIFMIVAAFKPTERIFVDLTSTRAFIPDPNNATIQNFETVFDLVPFDQFVFNSLLITIVLVFVGLFVNSMAAFTLARLRWQGRSLVLGITVSLIIIPLEAIAIPLLMQMNNLSEGITIAVLLGFAGLTVMLWWIVWNVVQKAFEENRAMMRLPVVVRWLVQALLALVLALPIEIIVYFLIGQVRDQSSWLNTYQVQIIPFIAEPFSIFLFYQFFIGIPKDFDEAAYVDGANYFEIYWRIVVPLSRPVFATIAILKFLQFWSFYMWPLMVVREDTYRPLMVGMDNFQTQQPIDWGAIMAYAAMVTIPVLVVFLLFQKWFVQSVSSSGVKG